MNNDADRAKLVRNVLIGVVVVVALLLAVLLILLGFGVRWYLSPENKLTIVQRRDLVQGLASGGQALAVFITGAVGLSGLFFTWRNTRQARDSTQRTLELTEQGQITDRFTKAIDQLGATDETTEKPRLEVRLGGIYALERIANDSPDRDYSTIMEVLTAYVRENAPRPQEVISSSASEPSETKPTASEPTNQEPPTPLADIQAILTVLGRRKKAGQEGDVVLDLSATDLRGAHLEEARLDKASLRRADLRRAHLEGADVRGANLLLYVTAGDDRHTIWDLRKYTIAELSGGGLTQKQLDETIGDESTLLPSDLKPPDHWDVKTDKQNEEG